MATIQTTENIPTEAKPPDTTGRGKYKDIPLESLIHYRAQKLSYQEIAKIVGCSWQNVQNRLGEQEVETLGIYRDNKADIFEHLQRNLIRTLTADEIKKISPSQRITAAAIIQDKIQDLRGQNNSNVKPMVVIQVNGSEVKVGAGQQGQSGGPAGSVIDVTPDSAGKNVAPPLSD